MKYINFKYTLFYLLLVLCCSCEPRVKLDLTRYGDTAFLLDARLFYLQQADRQAYEAGTLTGARRVFFSEGGATIDNANFTATIKVDSTNAAFLSEAGIVFTHRAWKIEPQNGAPVAGIPGNFTEGQSPFVYRVYSADGTTHDWIVDIDITP